MSNAHEGMSQFQQELQTVPIEDYTPVAEGKTQHPFKSNIYPQGSVHPKHNNPYGHAKFKYIEDKNHGRSIDEIASSGKVIWGGKYPCDIFGARDLKGARHETTAILVNKRDNGYKHIRALGLYDETDTIYLIRASELLRSKGIPTENVTNIYKINEVISDGKPVSIKEWGLYNVVAHAQKQLNEGKKDVEEIKQIQEFADKTEFFQVERELQVSERIRDLAVCTNEQDFKAMLKTPLTWLNTATKIKGEGIIPGTEKPEPFDIENKEDIKRYLEEYLPSQMGVYLGKLKKAGLKNDFGHAQQWSLAATMYDGQSFVGEELNGEKLTEEDYVESITEALGVLEELFKPNPENYIRKEFGDSLEKAKENLLINYFKEIGFPNIENAGAYSYEKLTMNSFFDGSKSVVRMLDPDTYLRARQYFEPDFDEDTLFE